MYAAFEMPNWHHPASTSTSTHGPVSRVLAAARRSKAYDDIGMRVAYSYAVRDQNRLVYEADEAFVQRLPASLAPDVAAYLRAQVIPLADHLGLFTELWERWQGRKRTRIQLAPANLHWCSDDALSALRQHAEAYRVGLHMHVLETPYQQEYARRRTGTTACSTSPTWACSARSSPSAMGSW